MADRRPLAAALTAIPDTDPDLVRSFITQEPRTRPTETRELSLVPEPSTDAPKPATRERSCARHRPRSAALTPVALIPVTVRLRPEIAGALKRASLERQLAGEEVFHQQDLVELALEPWLRSEGYLP